MRIHEWRDDLRERRQTLRAGAALLALAAALALVVIHAEAVWGALSKALGLLNPLLCGMILAYIFNVVARFFQDIVLRPLKDSRARRPLALALALLLVGGVLFFFFWYIIPHVLESVSGLAQSLQEALPGLIQRGADQARAFVERHNLSFLEDSVLGMDWTSLMNQAGKYTTDFLASLMNMTVNVASGVFTLVMGLIFSIYMVCGKERLLRGARASFLAFLPERAARRLVEVASLTNQVFSSFIRGQLTECLILGVECYIGMSILGLDYALLISFIVAMGPLVPILGAYLSAAAGALILLMEDPVKALIFLVFLLILMQIEANLVYPRIVGASIGLPPIWTMFAVLFWSGLLGIPGILVGTPTTAVLYRLFRAWVHGRLREKGIDPANPRLPPAPASPEEPVSGEHP